MAGDASAYAALGLDPGADSASIEAAYKKLIKEHHPDRNGGDSARAAEIIRAYREIRAERNLRDPLDLNDDGQVTTSGGRVWIVTAVLLALCVGLLALTQPLVSSRASGDAPGLIADRVRGSVTGTDPMDEPLHAAAIDGAVRNALQLARTRDEIALA